MILRAAVGLLLALAFTACGNGAANPPDAAPPDATVDAMVDYPAFHPSLPQILEIGGATPIMPSVTVVPVFFPGDPLHDQILDFLAKYAAGPEWHEMIGEYGVGALTIAAPVELGAAPPALVHDAPDIRTLVSTSWSPDPITVHVLFYPASTSIEMGGAASCAVFGGYHSAVGGVIYAVIPRCAPYIAWERTIDALTATVSHELVEAATDPVRTGYAAIDPSDAAWGAFDEGLELGDMCQRMNASTYLPADLGYAIQRTWSNAQAAAFQDPCVPPLPSAAPYFGAAPDMTTLSIPLGQSRTIAIDLFSLAPTTGPWVVSIQGDPVEKQTLGFSLDRATGVNGDRLMLTITAISPPSAGVAAFGVFSTIGQHESLFVGSVTVN
jgi:hypothetical protein